MSGMVKPGGHAARWPRRGLLLAVALSLGVSLGGCSSDNMFSMFGPKEPDVPQAPAGEYPNLGTVAPEVKRPPVLDPAQQARMESSLSALGQQTQQKGEAAEAAAAAP